MTTDCVQVGCCQGVALIDFLVTQADLIKNLRESRGLSQQNLATISRISPVTLNRAERGHAEVQPATAVRLLKAMNTNAQFSTEELGQIQESFRISAGVFIKAPAHPAPQSSTDHTPAALAAALAGIVGTQRASEILRRVLANEAKQFKPDRSLKYEQKPEGNTPFEVTEFVPTSPSKLPKSKVPQQKRRNA